MLNVGQCTNFADVKFLFLSLLILIFSSVCVQLAGNYALSENFFYFSLKIMIKILVLEDEEYRIKQFKQNTIGQNVTFVKTAAEAIKYLSENQYDYCYLDNDLTPEAYENYKKGILCDKTTGYAVCLWLEENPKINKNCKFVIHTLNEIAREKMKNALARRNFTVIPFYSLFK